MNETIPSLWWKWLLAFSIIGIIFALVMALAPGVLHSTLGQLTYNSFFEGDAYAELTEPELAYQDWLYSVLGSTMVGWLVVVGFIAYYSFRQGERWAWNAVAVGIVAWFVLDTGSSLANGVVFNAVFNLIFLAGFGAPLLATYRHFHPSK